MKRSLLLALAAMTAAGPVMAQSAPPTSIGGGDSITVQSTRGTKTVKDTTAHQTTSSGATVSTSTNNNDGKTPNGGVRSGGGGNAK